jgi:sigma-B regulation protein RsbU (phosphoserine phosphatase)
VADRTETPDDVADPNQDSALDDFYRALLDDDPQKLYDRAPCGYLSTTPDGTVVKVNDTFLTWTGHDRGELVGHRTFSSLLSPGGRIYHDTHYAPMLQMRDPVRENALDVVASDGSRLPVLVNAALERDADGRPQVIRVVVFDATERRAYERELLRAKQRAEESETRARSLARTLQQTLIPPSHPEIPGLELAAVYRPAGDGSEVGGDFYDVFQIGHDDWVIALGDVCGKGVDAAVLTSLVRHTVRALSVRRPGPAEALRALNDTLLRHGSERFCTVALLRLRRHDGRWRITQALGGHPPPVVVGQHGAARTWGSPGTLVGVVPDLAVVEEELTLAPGQRVLLYTDGVTEGRRDDAFYGEQRMREVVERHRASPVGITEALLGDLLGFQGGLPRDDVAVVCFGAEPEERPGSA